MPLMSFDEAYENSADCTKKHLILGNGFSIAKFPKIFHYGSLYEQADFKGNERLKSVFERLETQDFEEVCFALESAEKVLPVYFESKGEEGALLNDVEKLKEILISTIVKNHPENPNAISDDEYESCRGFLGRFLIDGGGHIFSLNYDLLLYWAIMHGAEFDEGPISLNAFDGFGNDDYEPDADYVVWKADEKQNDAKIHFMHGALHLFDAGSELRKFTWSRKQETLKSQSFSAIKQGMFPVFVSEGSSEGKKNKIRHSAYLYQCSKVLAKNADTGTHCFFVHGHSLATNDDHIFRRIAKGRCKKLFVSLYGDPDSELNAEIMRRASRLSRLREEDKYPLELAFYDAESAHIWG